MQTRAFYLGLILSLLFIRCGGEKQAEKKVIKPVKYAAVEQLGGAIIKSFNGTSQSGAETKLSFRTSGLIVKLEVKVGDHVKKGQLLAMLDLNDLKLNLQKATASLQSAQSQVETAKSSFDRIRELYQGNSASLNDYEQARNNYSAAQAAYQNAKKTLELQGSQLDYAKIIAPTDGVVSMVSGEINEFAAAGSPLIIINSNQNDIEVNVGVTENYISKITNGDEAEVRFTGIAEQKFKGVVSEVGFASAYTATSPVVLKLTEISKQMRPGMPVEVTFTFGDREERSTLSVPVSAVGQDHEGTFVFVLKPLQKNTYSATKTMIETGALKNEGFVVISGIREGDYVATAGLRRLYDGMEVKLLHH